MADIRFPGNTHRTAIVGHTGSGKTFAGMWHLSAKDFKRSSWTILDTKGDDLIRDIGKFEQVKHIKITDTPGPKGLHIVRPLPHQKEELNEFFRRIWTKGNRGIYVDEGYMIDKPDDYYHALLTQGRSLHVPMIILSQRPRYVSKFVFTEADFLQLFNLNYDDDRRELGNMTRWRYHPDTRLPDYHSVWYDVGRDETVTFSPVPPRRDILEAFKHQLDIRKVLI